MHDMTRRSESEICRGLRCTDSMHSHGYSPVLMTHAATIRLAPCRYPAEASAYDLLSEVGHGATATVWSARARGCGEYVAVKMFFLDHMKEDKVLICLLAPATSNAGI